MEEEWRVPPLLFTDFLEKMKDPAAANLVRMVKSFIKEFEDRRGKGTIDIEEDAKKVQDFYVEAERLFHVHPLWKGASGDDVEQAVEGLEKYVMSKLWKLTFAVTAEDKERDDRCQRLLSALSFVTFDALTGSEGPPPDEELVASAAEELLKADKYKAPRDKLVCLINVKKAVEGVIQAVVKAGRTDLGAGADAFFPALLLVVIRARPAHLASTIEYIKRFRGEQRRLRGQFDFMLANMDSVALYLETVNYEHLHISRKEFLERLAEAGLPEAILELDNSPKSSAQVETTLLEEEGPIGGAGTPEEKAETAQSLPEGHRADDGAAVNKEEEDAARAGDLLPVRMDDDRPLVSDLVRSGVTAVVQAEAEGKLQPKYPFMYADPEDLTLADVASVLQGYKQLALQFEALSSSVEALWGSTVDDQEVPGGPMPIALLDETLAELYPGDRQDDSPADAASGAAQAPDQVNEEEVFPGLSPEASATNLDEETTNKGASLQEPLPEASKPQEDTSPHETEGLIQPSPQVQTADTIESIVETTELTTQQQENDYFLNEDGNPSQNTEGASKELSLI